MKHYNYTQFYRKKFFRIRYEEAGKGYVGNKSFGTFEFMSEENARNHIKDKKLKDVIVEQVDSQIAESVNIL